MPRFTSRDIGDADRRSVLKLLGAGGAVAATGVGLWSLTGSAAAAEVAITSSNPETLVSDDGSVDEVYIAPSLNVTWDGFDEVVGKVRVLVEAATGAIDLDPPEVESLDYVPVFRATGYANGTDNDVEEETGPGTNGEFALDWFAGDERVAVYHADGPPDYETATYNCGATMETYLNGTLMGDPIEGAQNGFYGPAGDTDEFEAETDDGTNTTTVYLRYTVSLHAPDVTFIEEDDYALDPEDVKPNSPIAMAGGEDGQYPDLTDEAWGTAVTAEEASDYEALEAGELVAATAVPYDAMQASTDHPAIMVDYTHFDVTIDNEPADAGVTGDTGPGVSVDEDVGTMTPGNEATDTPTPGNETTDTPTPGNETTDTPTPGNETTDTPTPGNETTDTPTPGNETNGTDGTNGTNGTSDVNSTE